MTTLKRRVLFSSLAAAGLMLSSGVTLAADLDVSTIYGRGAPPNAHVTKSDAPIVTQTSRTTMETTVESDSADSRFQTAAMSGPEVTQAYPEHASQTVYPSSTPGQDSYTYAEDSTGRFHEEPLGMRQDWDVYAAAPVRANPLFDVADILGRASPPAPENAPDFGQPS